MVYFCCMNYLLELHYFGQVFLAMLLGGVLGWQRERWGKAAGPRTYGLVTAGAALFTILSLRVIGPSSAALIISGIGFLCAGIIFHKRDHVEGLTTAAGLWVSAAIGMAVGVQYYILATAVTVLILVLLMINDQGFKKSPPTT